MRRQASRLSSRYPTLIHSPSSSSARLLQRAAASSSAAATATQENSSPNDQSTRAKHDVMKLIRETVSAQSKTHKDPDWKRTPDRGVSEAQELREAVSSKGRNGKRPSAGNRLRQDPDVSLEASPELPDTLVSSIGDLRAGFYINVQRTAQTESGVVLGFEQNQRDLLAIFLNPSGEVRAFRLTDITFAYPNFVPHSLAAAAGLYSAPANETEIAARVQIVKQVRELEAAVSRAKSQIIMKGTEMYGHFQAPSRPANALFPESDIDLANQWATMTLDEALAFVWPQRATKTKYHSHGFQVHHALAMKEYLQAYPDMFIYDAFPLIQTQHYYVRPPEHLARKKRVSGWILNDDKRVDDFIAKAKTLVAHSKSLAAAQPFADGEEPVHEVPIEPAVTFDEHDRDIISFLRQSFLRQRFVQSDPYNISVAVIVKKVYTEDKTAIASDSGSEEEPAKAEVGSAKVSPSGEPFLDGSAGAASLSFQLLKDIGVFPQWSPLVNHGTDGSEASPRGLSLLPPGESQREKNVEKRALELLQSSERKEADGLPTMTDGLDSVRRDWGDTVVYVVDDPNSHELDDGISIEYIGDTPTLDQTDGQKPSIADGREPKLDNFDLRNVWVHVHVADPTSLIHADDPLGHHAEHMGSSTYFIERVYPMLPSSLVLPRFSLGSQTLAADTPPDSHSPPNSPAQPVLTFSFRINPDGSFAETKVQPGIVRNARRVAYDALDVLVGGELRKWSKPLEGHAEGAVAQDIQVPEDPETRRDLSVLYHMFRSVMKRRCSKPSTIEWSQPNLEVVLTEPEGAVPHHPTFLIADPSYAPPQPTFYHPLPRGSLEVSRNSHYSVAQKMIAECMVCAGQVAALFSREAGVPLLHRVSPPSTASEEDTKAIMKSRHPYSLNADLTELFKRHVIFGASNYSVAPRPHSTMGVDQYAQVTSPLRRSVDLINHWQIKAAFRNQLKTASLQAAFDRSGRTEAWPPAFTVNELSSKAVLANDHSKQGKRARDANKRFWALTLIEQALNKNSEHSLLSDMEGIIFSEVKKTANSYTYYVQVLLPLLSLVSYMPFDIVKFKQPEIGDRIRVEGRYVSMSILPKLVVHPKDLEALQPLTPKDVPKDVSSP